jgi:hypothetical protein
MPLLRYFVFVGGSLLALLFICDAVLPQMPLPENLTSGSDLPAVRIHSDRKWPERVVFDTNAPPVSPVTVAAAQAVLPVMAEASAKVRARDAFAQLPPPEPRSAGAKAAAMPVAEAVKTELKPQPKRKVARAHPAGRPVLLVAQQPRFGLFDTTW